MAPTRTDRHQYGTVFQNYAAHQAQRSAQAIVPVVLNALKCRTVLDVGCGTGMWLHGYLSHGVADAVGLDGAYVTADSLLIPKGHFRAMDISRPFDLGRTFDLVQCLEVAEHLHPDTSRTLIANLTAHGPRVLFSAAVPGQGGENHVNEQPYEFWRQLFSERRFVPFDFLRPVLRTLPTVAWWYRYNTLLYVQESACRDLPETVLRTRVPADRPIPDVAPLAFRARKAVLRNVPRSVVSRLAVLRHKLTPVRHGPD